MCYLVIHIHRSLNTASDYDFHGVGGFIDCISYQRELVLSETAENIICKIKFRRLVADSDSDSVKLLGTNVSDNTLHV